MANVVPLVMNIDRRFIPHYLLRYVPCSPHSDFQPTRVVMVGFFSSKFIGSGSELLMNYFEAFDLHSASGKGGQIDWLDNPTKIDEEYLLKKDYVFDVPPFMKRLVNNRLPLDMRSEFTEKHLKMLENNDRLMQAIVEGVAAQKKLEKSDPGLSTLQTTDPNSS